jgi:DUF917 family protein
MPRALTERDLEAALAGGAVLAAGGGGWAEHGRILGTAAIHAGRPMLWHPDELPDDAIIATAAAIGAPGDQTAWEMHAADYLRAILLLQEALGRPVEGLIIGQNGMSSTVNAWFPGAVMGFKVVDAVGDIRAHPTGDMGSLGMHASPEPTIQTGAGGNRAEGRYIELVLRGETAKISPVLRTAGHMAGGFIASCRNPVPNSRVKSHAAVGGISYALALGEAILKARPDGGAAVLRAICAHTRGRILAEGEAVRETLVYTPEAFDIGRFRIGDCELHLMNEWMAVERGGSRIASFPDVVTTLDAETGAPVSAGRIKPGQRLAVLHIPSSEVPLAPALLDPALYAICEERMGIELVRHLPKR